MNITKKYGVYMQNKHKIGIFPLEVREKPFYI